MIQAAAVSLAFLGIYLQLTALVADLGRQALGCTCRKNAVDWRCPVHGSGS